MSISIESLGIAQLSVQERLDLILEIWNTLPESVAPQDVPAGHLPELMRRRADAETRPNEGKPWREMLDSLESER